MLLHPKQKYKCRECDKQFVLNLEKKISEEKKAIIDKLLLDKISLRSIAISVGVSTVWLQKYVKEKYQEQPEELHIQKKRREKRRGKLEVEVDKLWSFVMKKQ